MSAAKFGAAPRPPAFQRIQRCCGVGLPRRSRSASWWTAVGLLAVLAVGQVHAQAPRLFSATEPSGAEPIERPPSEVVELGGATVRARRARMNFDLVARQDAVPGHVERPDPGEAAPAAFTLNLFDDAVYEVVVLRTAPTAGGYSLSGRLEGVPFGDVTLVVNGDVVAGSVTTPTATYSIRSTVEGAIEIRETDPSTLPPPAEPIVPPQPAAGSGVDALRSQGATTSGDEPTIIDLLVVYTSRTTARAGGRAQMEAHIDHLVAVANTAYLKSGVKQQLNLVLAEEVHYDGHDPLQLLHRLQNPSDRHLDHVHTLRDTYGADIVTVIDTSGELVLVNGQFHRNCGQAFMQLDIGAGFEKWAFNRLLYGCGGWSFTHELGHNMGLNHDRYSEVLTANMTNKPHPYAYGYVNQAAFKENALASAYWRTIMAYHHQCGTCAAIMRFSNPDQTHEGDPLGIPGDQKSNAVKGPADARRTLNISRTAVAGFRPTAPVRASARRLTPSREKTNADRLTWRVSFAPRGADGVDAADFALLGAGLGAPVLKVAASGGGKRRWDVTASGGNLAGLDGTVTLDFAAGHDITEVEGGAKVSSVWVDGSERTYELENVRPRVSSFARHDPTAERTNADALTWRVVFDEDVQGVDASDFELTGTTATLRVAAGTGTAGAASRTAFDATASGGDLASLSGTVTLGFAPGQNIADPYGNTLVATLPADAQASFVVSNPARPGTVAGVSVAAKVGSLEVSWRPARGATGYKVQWKPRKQSEYAAHDQATVAGDVTSYMIGGLSDDEEYAVRVLAVKAGADDGAPSAEVSGKPRGGSLAVAAVDASVREGAAARYRVTLSAPADYDVSVPVTVTETAAMRAGTPPTGFGVAAGEASAVLSVATDDDAVVEPASVITVTASQVPGYRASASAAEVLVRDDDAATLGVTASPAEIEEAGRSTVTVEITNGVTFAADQSVMLSTAGTAGAGDYALAPTTLTLAAGQSAVSATLTAVDDDIEEPDETVVLEARHDGASIGSATVTIRANDTPSDDATLASLRLSGVDIGTFSAATLKYSATVAHDVATTTVTVRPAHSGASATIADATGSTNGTTRIVPLSEGANTITV